MAAGEGQWTQRTPLQGAQICVLNVTKLKTCDENLGTCREKKKQRLQRQLHNICPV